MRTRPLHWIIELESGEVQNEINQIYATHCTYGSSAIERRQGELADRVLGYSARASSFPQSDLRKNYRAIERYLHYHLPKDASAESKLQFTAASAPKRLVYVPSINGLHFVAHIAYRQKDVANRAESYFAHALLTPHTDNKSAWSATQCLQLWGSESWVREDSPSHPFDLPTMQRLSDFSDGLSSHLNDDVVHRFFTENGFSPPSLAGDPCVANRWAGVDLDTRRSLLTKALHGFLEVSRQPRQSLLIVIEPQAAVLFFYAICRFFPPRMIHDIVSFSTYEPHTGRLTTSLAATCFCDNNSNDVPADQYQRGNVLNSFTGRHTTWNPETEQYAQSMVRTLADGGWNGVFKCLGEYKHAGAKSIDHLLELHATQNAVDAILTPPTPIPGGTGKRSPLSLTFMASHIHDWLGDGDDESRIISLINSEPHLFAVLQLLPALQCKSGGEELRRRLLDIVPESLFSNLLRIDIPETDKATAVASFIKCHGRLPADLEGTWDVGTSTTAATDIRLSSEFPVRVLRELSSEHVRRIWESLSGERLLSFCICLIRVRDTNDYKKDRELQSVIKRLSPSQSLAIVRHFGKQIETLSPPSREELARQLNDIILSAPDDLPEFLGQLDTLEQTLKILDGGYARRLVGWLELRLMLREAGSQHTERRSFFRRNRHPNNTEKDAFGEKLAVAVCEVIRPSHSTRRKDRDQVLLATKCIHAVVEQLECDPAILPDEMGRKLANYFEYGFFSDVSPIQQKSARKGTRQRNRLRSRVVICLLIALPILALAGIGYFSVARYIAHNGDQKKGKEAGGTALAVTAESTTTGQPHSKEQRRKKDRSDTNVDSARQPNDGVGNSDRITEGGSEDTTDTLKHDNEAPAVPQVMPASKKPPADESSRSVKTQAKKPDESTASAATAGEDSGPAPSPSISASFKGDRNGADASNSDNSSSESDDAKSSADDSMKHRNHASEREKRVPGESKPATAKVNSTAAEEMTLGSEAIEAVSAKQVLPRLRRDMVKSSYKLIDSLEKTGKYELSAIYSLDMKAKRRVSDKTPKKAPRIWEVRLDRQIAKVVRTGENLFKMRDINDKITDEEYRCLRNSVLAISDGKETHYVSLREPRRLRATKFRNWKAVLAQCYLPPDLELFHRNGGKPTPVPRPSYSDVDIPSKDIGGLWYFVEIDEKKERVWVRLTED